MKKYKRKRFLIKRALQVKLLLGYFFFVISGGIFFIILMGFFTTESMTISYNSNNMEMVQTPLTLLKQSLSSQWMFLVAGALALAIMAVRITHRVAGPLFRFEQNLDNMLTGDLGDTIYLRSKDEGKDLAGKLNAFNKGLSINIYTVTKESRAIARLTRQAQKVATQLPTEQRDKIQSILWSIEEKNKKISKASNQYTP
ncbi:MAG: methyl-accepting chemotaxis protein [Desulforhopalus sp.]|jgi:methyl-accepting chemotaxis protein